VDDCVVIALFRHGITEENKRKAYLGWNDSPLCPESNSLSTSRRYDLYFSSDLPRCISTAKMLFLNKNLILLEQLREMNFGYWEGHTYEDLKEDLLYQRWLTEPDKHNPPNGESLQQFTKRVQTGWERLTQEIFSHNFQSCAVMTHGGVIKYLLSELAPEQKNFWFWQVSHDHGFELIFNRESLRRGERCTLLREVPLTGKAHG
jgi:alpha-ribazole phosphatase